MGGKGKKRHQNIGGQLVGKKQKQSFGKNKDDGGTVLDCPCYS